MLKMTEQYRTKSGGKRHRQACRFVRVNAVQCQDNPVDRKLGLCAVCKPQLSEAMLPAQVAHELGSCGVCLKGKGHGLLTPEAATTAGYKVTRTGVKYHTAECKHAGGVGVKVPAKPAAKKPLKPIKPQAQAVAF